MFAMLQTACGSKEYQSTCLHKCPSYLNSLYIWDFLQGSLNLHMIRTVQHILTSQCLLTTFVLPVLRSKQDLGTETCEGNNQPLNWCSLQLWAFVDILCFQTLPDTQWRAEKGFDGIFLFDKSKWKEAGHVQIINLHDSSTPC